MHWFPSLSKNGERDEKAGKRVSISIMNYILLHILCMKLKAKVIRI